MRSCSVRPKGAGTRAVGAAAAIAIGGTVGYTAVSGRTLALAASLAPQVRGVLQP